MRIAASDARAVLSRAVLRARVSSWAVSRIRFLGPMTIPAAEPDPQARERESDRASVADAAGEGRARRLPGGGGLVLLHGAQREFPRATREADASATNTRACLSDTPGSARRLRVAGPAQLELLCDRRGARPEVVWASLPEQTRETVLVLLARLIGSGAIEERNEEWGEW